MARIGLDARMIDCSGIGSYLRGLIGSWATTPPGGEVILFGSPARLEPYPFSRRSLTAPVYSLREQWRAPAVYSAAGLDLLHVPHYTIPLLYKGPLVVTIHDIIHLLFPASARMPGARAYARFMLGRAVRRAARILTVSGRTRDDLITHLGADPERIRVIPPGVDNGFRPAPAEAARPVLARHGLRAGFILFVGDLRPYKNVEALMRAHSILRSSWADCPPLVLVGRTERANGMLSSADPSAVRALGPLPADDLVALYSSAGALAFPSLYEGFGLPPLEAMACGCPVVSSAAGGLRESIGDAGIVIDPREPGSLAEGLRTALRDETARKRLIEKGHERARRFQWEESAQKVWAVYEEVLGK